MRILLIEDDNDFCSALTWQLADFTRLAASSSSSLAQQDIVTTDWLNDLLHQFRIIYNSL